MGNNNNNNNNNNKTEQRKVAKYANDWAVGEDPKPGNKRVPKYIVPKSFTNRFLVNSASRQGKFTQGLKAWVDAHAHDQTSSSSSSRPKIITRTQAHKDQDTQIARSLAKVLDSAYVTLPEFLSVLRRHLLELSKTMAGPYYMAVQSMGKKIPKSSAWLAPMVNEALHNRHAVQGYLEYDVEDDSITIRDSSGPFGGTQWPVGAGRNIIYVDDGVYSGRQLREFVATLIGFLWRAAKKNSKTGKPTRGRGQTHVWIVIPYRTRTGQALLSDLQQGKFIDDPEDYRFIFGLGANVPTQGDMADIMDFAKRELAIHIVNLDKYEKIPDTREVLAKTGVEKVLKGGNMGSGLLVFEHKVPDSMSFPRALRWGQQVRYRKIGMPGIDHVPFVTQNDGGKPYSKKAPGMTRHLYGNGDEIMMRALEKKSTSKESSRESRSFSKNG